MSNAVIKIHPSSRNRAVQQRAGAIVPLTVILLVVLGGMVAFAVDLGYLSLARTEIQAAADAGALAGAMALSNDAYAESRLLARTAVRANTVAGSPLEIRSEDVELGIWNAETREFEAIEDESKANSVRVTCQRTTARGNPIQLFFAPLLGTSLGEATASAVAVRSPICGSFVGVDSVDLNGSGAYTDSYISRLGPYASQAPRDQGHICSNGDINVQNGTVNGNAIPGPGDDVSVGNGSVSGSMKPRDDEISVPPVDFGDVMNNNDNDDLPSGVYNSSKVSFKHNGGAINLSPGDYYFTDFRLNGGPVIVHGPVNIYVKGDVSAAGNSFLNTTHSPGNLRIYADGKDVSISGSADFVGVVYAPTSRVRVGGNAAFYGAVIGKTLKFHNGGGIHADESVLGPLPARSRLVD